MAVDHLEDSMQLIENIGVRSQIAQMMANWGQHIPALDRGDRETTLHIIDGQSFVDGIDGQLHLVEPNWAAAMACNWQVLKGRLRLF